MKKNLNMMRVFQIIVLSCLPLLVIGCNSREKNEPIWQQVKIRDLAPSYNNKQPGGPARSGLKTLNFEVDIFEIPAENISALDNVWQVLEGPHFAGAPHAGPLRFNDYDAFKANSFLAGLGGIQGRNMIVDLLLAADGKRIKMVSLLLLNGQTQTIALTRLQNRQTIFYVSSGGSMEGVSIGPGELGLQIRAEKIPSSRGVCKMDALPISRPPVRSSIPQLAAHAKANEVPFTPAGFELKMSPGDLVLLGPEKYIGHQKTLGSLFFSKPEGSLFFSTTERKPPEYKPAVRILLLVCTGINY